MLVDLPGNDRVEAVSFRGGPHFPFREGCRVEAAMAFLDGDTDRRDQSAHIERPALKLTPSSLASQITAAAENRRADDQCLLKIAAAGMDAATGRIDAMIARYCSVAEQHRELLRNRVAFAVAGMVTFAILPGAVARSLPVSWAVPERIAARMLGADMWRAGQSMMAKAEQDRWNEIIAREQAKRHLESRDS